MGDGEKGRCNIVCPFPFPVVDVVKRKLLLLTEPGDVEWFGNCIVGDMEDAVVETVNKSAFNLVGVLTRIRKGDIRGEDCSRFGMKLFILLLCCNVDVGKLGCGLRICTGV